MDALTLQGPKIRRHRRHQGLAFTSLHFGDVPAVKGCPAHHLNVEGSKTKNSPGSLAHRCEGFHLEVVKGLPLCQALLELSGLRAELIIAKGLKVLLQRIDLAGNVVELAQLAPFAGAKDLVDDGHWTPKFFASAPKADTSALQSTKCVTK